MITDPSWLYSTIAQSSAAIVAIIGGFITASVLTLRAEKRTLANQQADKITRLEAVKSENERLSDLYEKMKAETFLEEIIYDYTEEEELPSLEELIQRNPEYDIDTEILKHEYSLISKRRIEAREFICKHSEEIDATEHIEFDEWVAQNKLDISTHNYYMLKNEYDRICEHKIEIPEQSGAFGLSSRPTVFKMPYITPQGELRELENMRDRLGNVRYELSTLEREVSSLDTRISEFSYPPNLGWGLFVLVVLALFGIIIPLSVIFAHAFSTTNSIIAMVSFILGLSAVFTYIYFQVKALRRTI